MKRPLLSLFTLALIVLTACSGQMDAGDGNIKTPTSQSPPTWVKSDSGIDPDAAIDVLEKNKDEMFALFDQGVCIVYLYFGSPVSSEAKGKIESKADEIIRSHHVPPGVGNCLAGWQYAVVIGDSGATIMHECGVPDVKSGGYAALLQFAYKDTNACLQPGEGPRATVLQKDPGVPVTPPSTSTV